MRTFCAFCAGINGVMVFVNASQGDTTWVLISAGLFVLNGLGAIWRAA